MTACCDDAAHEDLARLEGMVCDRNTTELVLDFFQLDGGLHRLAHKQFAAEKCLAMLGLGIASPKQVVESAALPERLSPAPTFLSTTFPSTLGYSSGWPVAYLIATVITGLWLLSCGLHPYPVPSRLLRNPLPPPAGRQLAPEPLPRIGGPDHRHGRLQVGGERWRVARPKSDAISKSQVPNPQIPRLSRRQVSSFLRSDGNHLQHRGQGHLAGAGDV